MSEWPWNFILFELKLGAAFISLCFIGAYLLIKTNQIKIYDAPRWLKPWWGRVLPAPTDEEKLSRALKSCPFCGGEASLYSDYKHDPEKRYYWALCDNDACLVECFTDNDYYSEESAIKMWNTRAPKCDKWGVDEEMDKAVDKLVEAAYKRKTVRPLTRKVSPQDEKDKA